jgi:hypothetical protein
MLYIFYHSKFIQIHFAIYHRKSVILVSPLFNIKIDWQNFFRLLRVLKDNLNANCSKVEKQRVHLY